MSRLFERLWPSRTAHRELLKSGEETREKLLKLAGPYRIATIANVIEATDQAADFKQ